MVRSVSDLAQAGHPGDDGTDSRLSRRADRSRPGLESRSGARCLELGSHLEVRTDEREIIDRWSGRLGGKPSSSRRGDRPRRQSRRHRHVRLRLQITILVARRPVLRAGSQRRPRGRASSGGRGGRDGNHGRDRGRLRDPGRRPGRRARQPRRQPRRRHDRRRLARTRRSRRRDARQRLPIGLAAREPTVVVAKQMPARARQVA